MSLVQEGRSVEAGALGRSREIAGVGESRADCARLCGTAILPLVCVVLLLVKRFQRYTKTKYLN